MWWNIEVIYIYFHWVWIIPYKFCYQNVRGWPHIRDGVTFLSVKLSLAFQVFWPIFAKNLGGPTMLSPLLGPKRGKARHPYKCIFVNLEAYLATFVSWILWFAFTCNLLHIFGSSILVLSYEINLYSEICL